MRIAIIGSRNAPVSSLFEFISSQVGAWLRGHYHDDIHLGTFLNGPVHSAAVQLAAQRNWQITRFHSDQALARWRPEVCFIFWDGASLGCQVVLEHLCRAQIYSLIFLTNGRAMRFLGSSASAIGTDSQLKPSFATLAPSEEYPRGCPA